MFPLFFQCDGAWRLLLTKLSQIPYVLGLVNALGIPHPLRLHTPISCIVDEVSLINKFFWFTKTGSCYFFFLLQFVITLLMKNARSLALVIVRSVLHTPHMCKRYSVIIADYTPLVCFSIISGEFCLAMFWILTWHCHEKYPWRKQMSWYVAEVIWLSIYHTHFWRIRSVI